MSKFSKWKEMVEEDGGWWVFILAIAMYLGFFSLLTAVVYLFFK